jgi:hypothetical protein
VIQEHRADKESPHSPCHPTASKHPMPSSTPGNAE